MVITLREALDKIRSSPDPKIEEAVKFRIVAPILAGLGWDTAGPEVQYEYGVGRGRVDFALLRQPGDAAVFVEAKALRVDLDRHVEQVVRYAFHESVEICVLTNGLEWWMYLPTEPVRFEERRFAVLRIKVDPVEQLHDDLVGFLSRENVVSGQALENARRRYMLDKTIPEVWRKMQEEPDDALLDLVRQRVSEQLGLLPTVEEVRNCIFPVPGPRPDPDTPPHQPPPRPAPGQRPIGFRLWGESYPVRFGNEVLLGVADVLHRIHGDGFTDRVLRLSWASLDRRGDRWKEVSDTGVFLNVNFKVDELIDRSRTLLEVFGHPGSDLEVDYG